MEIEDRGSRTGSQSGSWPRQACWGRKVEETGGSERVRREQEKEKIQEIVGASVRSCVQAPGVAGRCTVGVGSGAVSGEGGEGLGWLGWQKSRVRGLGMQGWAQVEGVRYRATVRKGGRKGMGLCGMRVGSTGRSFRPCRCACADGRARARGEQQLQPACSKSLTLVRCEARETGRRGECREARISGCSG